MLKSQTALKRIALLAAVCALLLLAACSAPVLQLPSAQIEQPGTAGYSAAQSYAQIYDGILAGLDAAEIAVSQQTPENPPTPAARPETTSATTPEAEPADVDLVDARGYYYLVDYTSEDSAPGVLRVFRGGEGSSLLITELGLYDLDGGSENVQALLLWEETLLVQCAVTARVNDYQSPDYALAAYAAPSTTLLFIDVSVPEKPEFIKSLGFNGSGEVGQQNDGLFYLQVEHPTAQPAALGANWGLSQLATSEVSAADAAQTIKKSLQLRQNDPVAFVPSYYEDGALYPFAPEQLFVPAQTRYDGATILACVDIAAQSCPSAVALFWPYPYTTPAYSWEGTSLRLS